VNAQTAKRDVLCAVRKDFMTEENKDTQSVSIEEYNTLKADFEKANEKLGKLEKIFEERQTKTFDKNKAISKEVLLKELGLVKDPEKTEIELVNEKFATLSKTVEDLTAQIKEKDGLIALNNKKSQVSELAKKYNFIDVNDVLGVIDYNNENFDEQLKTIAESKKHWVRSVNLGGSFAGGKEISPQDLETRLQEAYKNHDIQAAISLKRQMYEKSK
jgi:hypothetical protein